LPKFNFKTLLFALLLSISFVIIVISQLAPIDDASKILLTMIAALSDVLAFSVRYYSYLYLPFVKMKNRTAILSYDEPYYFSPANNAIIVRDNDTIYASAFIKIPIYKSSTEMGDEEKADFARTFSKVIALGKTPYKMVTQLYIVNKDRYLDQIKEKLNIAESMFRELSSKKGTDPNELEIAKGELTMWHNLFDNIIRVQSSGLMTYAMVTASGGTDDEAVNLALQQAEEVSAGISSTLGVNTSLATENEIRLMIEPDFIVPYSTISEQIKQRTAEESV
jgi:hypothetical protein